MKKNKTTAEKPVRFTYQILNIKLLSNQRSGTDAYRQILEDIYTSSIKKPISRGKMAIIRTMFPETIDGKKFFYGKISRFTNIENQNWINLTTKEIEQPDFNPNLFPNLQETEYIFIPQAHRFVVKLSPEFSIHNSYDFFLKAIKEVIEPNEDFKVTIQQSTDIFDEIYNAISVEKLFITLSYTNSDNIEEDATEWLDSQLRESNTKESKMYFESAKNETINIDTSLIRGALKLAIENGEVEAKIKDKTGRIRRIITKDHPEKNRSIASSEMTIKDIVFNEVMERYKRNDKLGD